MKKAIALLGLVLVAGTISKAQEPGKIGFFECRPSVTQKARLFMGADKKELMNVMAAQGQCSLATDLSFENAAQALRNKDIQSVGLVSVDQLPYGYMRNYCDGEDTACMNVEEVDREGEANMTWLLLNQTQIQTLTTIAADGIANKPTKKNIYFIADESKKDVSLGEGEDGNWTTIDLKKSTLLIK